ncbi:MAG TPA: DUF6152 family protein [Bryobacteraceae bacterium]
MRAKLTLLAVAVFVAAIPAAAHHSFAAEYDASATVTLKGVVTKVEWTNPHAYIYVDVKDETGKVVNWGMEGYPPNTLTRTGFTRHIVKEGDTITITGYKARDSAARAAAREVTTSEGKKYNFGPAA